MWSTKLYALSRLRECANRLHAPDLSNAFSFWSGVWRQLKHAQLASQFADGNAKYSVLEERISNVTRELELVVVERNALREKVSMLTLEHRLGVF